MNTNAVNNRINKIFTIPNLLSLFRLCLIPIIIHQYCITNHFTKSAALLLLSGITDIADGFIARRFHMISNVGKILDPIADKLTQFAVMICLISRFSFMLFPFFILLAKETLAGIIGFITIRKTNTVPCAKWHGKLSTVSLYAVLFVHIIRHDLPHNISIHLILCSILLMLLSSLLYTFSGIRQLINQNVHHNSFHNSQKRSDA